MWMCDFFFFNMVFIKHTHDDARDRGALGWTGDKLRCTEHASCGDV